jgi:hypothetical protein
MGLPRARRNWEDTYIRHSSRRSWQMSDLRGTNYSYTCIHPQIIIYPCLTRRRGENVEEILTRLSAQIAGDDQQRNISRVWMDNSRVGLRIGQARCNRPFPLVQYYSKMESIIHLRHSYSVVGSCYILVVEASPFRQPRGLLAIMRSTTPDWRRCYPAAFRGRPCTHEPAVSSYLSHQTQSSDLTGGNGLVIDGYAGRKNKHMTKHLGSPSPWKSASAA